MIFSREEDINWLPIAKYLVLKTYTRGTVYVLNVFYLYVCVYTYMYAITISKKECMLLCYILYTSVLFHDQELKEKIKT